MVYKCKICAGSLTVDPKSRIAVCDYCGSKQVLPLFSDESAQLLYDRGNSYLRQSEYDKAETIFNQLVSLCPEDPEIYWNLVLCRYGVTFVNDPKTGKYVPTCNRTHFQSVFQDANYLNAIKYSDDEKAAYFKENAETIDKIQKGILAVSKKEKPFDIFISYKETDSVGARTRDSVRAQELYEKLTEEGYKVFFSRITLEDKIGTEYEPYIYAAIYSSKVMVTVCSSRENIESAWVKNEWSRFLTLYQSDAGKTLIPLYFDMPKSDLPDEFAIFTAQDMGKEDFEQEFLRGIKKMIPLPVMLSERRKKLKKRLGITAAVLTAAVLAVGVVVYPYIRDNNKYQSAIQLYNEGKYQEAADAFAVIPDFKDASAMRLDSLNMEQYTAAMQLYDEKKYAEAADAFGEIPGYKDSSAMREESLNMEKYTAAMGLYYDGNYPEAAWALRDMNGYRDSAEMQTEAELIWRESNAAFATANVIGWGAGGGSYYISPNGTVETFNFDPGIENTEIQINEHGKIVSIESGLYALYEDGYVFNAEGCDNAIQISPRFITTGVALTNDGHMVLCGPIQNEWDRWLEAVTEWENIVSFSYGYYNDFEGWLSNAAIVGIKADGTVDGVFFNSTALSRLSLDFLHDLTDIEKVSISLSGTEVGYADLVVDEDIFIAAMDSKGVLYTFENGAVKTEESLDIVDFEANNLNDLSGNPISHALFVIDESQSLSMLGSEKTIMEDVIRIDKDFLVTQSGTIYRRYNVAGTNPENTSAKTQIQDIWLSR